MAPRARRIDGGESGPTSARSTRSKLRTGAPGRMSVKPATTVDAYLARVPQELRGPLRELRATIRSAAPEAIESISYQIPTFRYHGGLVGFAAFRDHCGFFVMSPAVMDAFREELAGYDTSKGAIRFAPNAPLPAALVRCLVRARVAENESRDQKERTAAGPS